MKSKAVALTTCRKAITGYWQITGWISRNQQRLIYLVSEFRIPKQFASLIRAGVDQSDTEVNPDGVAAGLGTRSYRKHSLLVALMCVLRGHLYSVPSPIMKKQYPTRSPKHSTQGSSHHTKDNTQNQQTSVIHKRRARFEFGILYSR
jgi:hypothetical protein